MIETGSILHADVDAFFASVEQRDDPSLRGRPVIVGPGVVMAASYEAKARGVKSGMGARQALARCPEAVVVSPRFSAYTETSRALFRVFNETTPVVEGISMEEAFLDVRGLEQISGTPVEIATRLRAEVRAGLGLPISVGIARTRALAKMASRAAKPDGLLAVGPDHESAFLHPLPIESLWGVGSSTARKLSRIGVRTAGDAAALDEARLVAALGRASGRHVHALVHCRDYRPIRAGRGRRSFGAQSALGRRERSPAELDAVLITLVDRVTSRMRKKGRVGRTVLLRLRFGDYKRATRSRTLLHPTAVTATVLTVGRELLAEAAPAIRGRGLTLVGVAITNIAERSNGVQMVLPFERSGWLIDAALDEIRTKFGADAITRGARRRAPVENLSR